MEFIETAWKGFRNLKPRRQKWCSGLNVLLGPNGSGKTNMLESMSVLCGWGAFAKNKTSSMVAWDAEENKAFLSAQTSGERDLEVSASISTRTTLRAANDRTTYSTLRSLLPSLSFLPRDIDLLDGSPSVRRMFLDKLCALCSPLYARRLAEYKQLVRHRTAFLRQGRSPQVTVLPMVQLGGWIWANRRRVVDLLAETLLAEHELSPFSVSITLRRQGFVGFQDEKNTTEEMAAILNASLERERHAAFPVVGPHRDDLLVSCLGRPASTALSRGQKRRVVMAMILAAGRLIEARMRLKPILLLDDIAAELDAGGRKMLATALEATGWQIFVTGTEDHFQTSGSTLWHIQNGKITSPGQDNS